MKILITTDLHIHNHLGEYSFIKNAGDYLSYLLEYSKKNDIKKIIIAGDIFNCNHYINHVALIMAKEKFHDFKDAGIEVILLTGNHDLFNKNTTERALTKVFRREFTVPEDYEKIKVDDVVFHFKNYGSSLGAENFSMEDGLYNCLVCHLEVNGFKMSNITVKDKISRKDFSKFDIVFDGHHHDYEHIDNIITIGAPYHINFGDAGRTRGFLTFDTSNKEYKFEKYDGVTFVKLFPEKHIDINAIKNHFVRLEYNKDSYDKKDILKIKKELSVNNYYVDIIHRSVAKKDTIKKEIELDTFDLAFVDYIKKYNNGLSVDELTKVFEEMKSETD